MSSKKFHNVKFVSFGERLREIRLDHGMLKSEFAKSLDWSRSGITKYENNQIFPEINKIIALSKKYTVNLHWLITGRGEKYFAQPQLFIVPGSSVARDDEGHYRLKEPDGVFKLTDEETAQIHIIMQNIYLQVEAANHPVKQKLIKLLDAVLDLIEEE